MINLKIVNCLSEVGWNANKSEVGLLLNREGIGHIIAAHEIAHCKLRHPSVARSPEQLWSQELEAWALARKWLEASGEWTAEAESFARATINTYRSECFCLAPLSGERKAIEEMERVIGR